MLRKKSWLTNGHTDRLSDQQTSQQMDMGVHRELIFCCWRDYSFFLLFLFPKQVAQSGSPPSRGRTGRPAGKQIRLGSTPPISGIIKHFIVCYFQHYLLHFCGPNQTRESVRKKYFILWSISFSIPFLQLVFFIKVVLFSIGREKT